MVGSLRTMAEGKMRRLNDEFLHDLRDGVLAALTDAVRSDTSLCLELRGDYINVYYRGGNLMKVKQSAKENRYAVTFDKKYFKGRNATLPRPDIQGRGDITKWLDVSPELKQIMDQYFGKHRANEREFQQILVRDNNFGSVARSTDYYICDIEYNTGSGKGKGKQFDMVAVHWPSESPARKRADNRRIVIIEVKYGDGALAGKAGLHAHIEDANKYLSTPDDVKRLKEDMLAVFNQKRELDLIDCGEDLRSFSDEKPLLLLGRVIS